MPCLSKWFQIFDSSGCFDCDGFGHHDEAGNDEEQEDTDDTAEGEREKGEV